MFRQTLALLNKFLIIKPFLNLSRTSTGTLSIKALNVTSYMDDFDLTLVPCSKLFCWPAHLPLHCIGCWFMTTHSYFLLCRIALCQMGAASPGH